MFPPFASTESIYSEKLNPLMQAYRDVVIYGDTDSEDTLYEGPIVVHANGWVELEGDRLLSPHAIHHIDIYDDEREGWNVDEDDDRTDNGHDGRSGDDSRTNRFSPK